MQEVFQLLERVIPTSATVVITGESGTGKELIARAIHYAGERKDRAFVAENCAALPESLLESELFGHAKGAFTGATTDKKGLFEVADGGTIFLDEIADTSPAIQVKLLRVVQEREIRRIGEAAPRKVDVRIMAASNKDLEKEIQEGRFREDLYFRLNVVSIHIPPLRERKVDIPLLAAHFLERYSETMNKALRGFSPAVMDLLTRYPWPGNIRELENTIERAVVVADEERILSRHLPQEMLRVPPESREKAALSLEDLERAQVERALIQCGWNQTKAAQLLGITRDKLRYRMKKYEIETERRNHGG